MGPAICFSFGAVLVILALRYFWVAKRRPAQRKNSLQAARTILPFGLGSMAEGVLALTAPVTADWLGLASLGIFVATMAAGTLWPIRAGSST